jgi:hypothetical protein
MNTEAPITLIVTDRKGYRQTIIKEGRDARRWWVMKWAMSKAHFYGYHLVELKPGKTWGARIRATVKQETRWKIGKLQWERELTEEELNKTFPELEL